jgi:hypothetical protein
MRATVRRGVLLGALATCLAMPGVASAYSGSITNVHPSLDGSTVYATYTTTFDRCSSSGFCGWFPHAWEVPASSPCFVDMSHFTYVGNYQDTSGTQVGTDYFYPHYNPTRICLYVSGPDDVEYLIADYVYPGGGSTPLPAATPTPTPTPTSTQPATQPTSYVAMTISEARSDVPVVLRKEYGSRFARSTLTRACLRASSRKVRCRVAWRKSPYKYSGAVTLWYGDDDAANDYATFTYTRQIRRTRIKGRSSSGGSTPASLPARPSCNPNYTGVCLPLTGDVNCGDITARNFGSVGSDPFRLDGDHDGIACES